MGRNVEIKARLSDPEGIRSTQERLSGSPPEVLEQSDTFFSVPRGRLKLRMQGDRSELIYYERPDLTSAKESSYCIFPVERPDLLLEVLAPSIGIRGKVEKRRHLYRVGNTRIHLDEVKGLGGFIELEVVLDEGENVDDGAAIANRLMEKLGIAREDLVACAYIDLLEGEGK